MAELKVYTREVPPCPKCNQAKMYLMSKKVDYTAIIIGKDITLEAFGEKFPGITEIPYATLDDTKLGGLQEIQSHVMMGSMSL